MFTPDQYELLDFGDGRKLERFGSYVLDRPSPAAEGTRPAHPAAWRKAAARYERTENDRGQWQPEGALPDRWIISDGELIVELKPTVFGHLGLFPEQAENWDWIAAEVGHAPRTLKMLNLFAYTGGSTLAAAKAGAEVVHVDAAQNVVAWARRNAELSNLADAPIRWITEDAIKFARRELRRGHRYDAVILDPPSYGHGPKGEVWKLPADLPALVDVCRQLTEGRCAFVLATCHTPGVGAATLADYLKELVPRDHRPSIVASDLFLETADGRRLPSGVMARWSDRQ